MFDEIVFDEGNMESVTFRPPPMVTVDDESYLLLETIRHKKAGYYKIYLMDAQTGEFLVLSGTE